MNNLFSDEGSKINLAEQTIEMFEVITKMQPFDYQSLEILRNAYVTLNQTKGICNTTQRIIYAYLSIWQLYSALLECEEFLKKHPENDEIQDLMLLINEMIKNDPSKPPQKPPPKPPEKPPELFPMRN